MLHVQYQKGRPTTKGKVRVGGTLSNLIPYVEREERERAERAKREEELREYQERVKKLEEVERKKRQRELEIEERERRREEERRLGDDPLSRKVSIQTWIFPGMACAYRRASCTTCVCMSAHVLMSGLSVLNRLHLCLWYCFVFPQTGFLRREKLNIH